MNALRVFARRAVFGALSAWAVMTTVFLSFTLTPDWVAARLEGQIIWANTGPGEVSSDDRIEQQIEQTLSDYTAARGFDRPLYEQYIDWMGNMVTLDWGNSFQTGEAVFPMVTDAAVRTGQYLVPALVLAVLLGTLIGLCAALYPDSRLTNSGRIGAYALFAVPGFWLGGMFVSGARGGVIGRNTLLFDHLLPISLVTMTLLGGYVSYSRAYAREFTSAEFVTLVRAKGAGSVQVARHVLRNAAIPLMSMLFTEALGLLVLAIFVVEVLFGIEGFGLVFFESIDARDLPVLLGCALVIILVAVVGNILQDLSYQYLDPRVEQE